jgi:predicted alpha/beta-fold hydrolase
MIDYKRPCILFNSHVETVYPAIFRYVSLSKKYERERLILKDGDFLDLDWVKTNSQRLVIVSHGLEGNTNRGYVMGMVNVFSSAGFDCVAWNYRGCSEEMNWNLKFYHSGATDDLGELINHATRKNAYTEIVLIGFSLGGNLTLKYLGERKVEGLIRKAVVFSVPCHLHSCCLQLSTATNRIYSNRFLKSLKNKIRSKAQKFAQLDVSKLEKVDSLFEFDDNFTAPLHGFNNAIDYYQKSSSVQFLKSIEIPTLLVNAANDPFLSRECFPVDLLHGHKYVKIEIPEKGGHVGFTLFNRNGLYWSELRALDFIQTYE